MKIVGCDLHTRYQQVAMLDQETGEWIERRLEHENGEARAFYAALSSPVRVGIEATGPLKLLLLEWGSSNVRAQKAMTQEKAPSPGPGFVKLDFLIGTKWGSNALRKQKRPSRSPK
jgi:hypothetical protein